MFIGILLIFLGVIKNEAGDSWLSYIWDYIGGNWMTGPVVSGIVLVGILVAVIWFVNRLSQAAGILLKYIWYQHVMEISVHTSLPD